MDSSLKEFQSGPVKAVGYADDIIIMASGIDMRINAENIQLALNKIINWGKAKELVFNPSKTQAIIFDRSKKYKASPPSIVMDVLSSIDRMQLRQHGVSPMSHKDGDQTATSTRAWRPIVLGEWTNDTPMLRPMEEVPILSCPSKLCQNQKI